MVLDAPVCAAPGTAAAASTKLPTANDVTLRTASPLLSLRDAYEIVEQLALLGHLHACVGLNESETPIDLHQICLALSVDVAHDVGDTERELALLPVFALIDQRTHTTNDLGLGAGGRRSRASRAGHHGPHCALRRPELSAKTPFERIEIGAPRLGFRARRVDGVCRVCRVRTIRQARRIRRVRKNRGVHAS